MKLALLAAVAENGAIGHKGEFPWRLPAELQHVKALTTGHCIVMGRKTYESIGRPLPKRTNVVVSGNRDLRAEGVVVVASFEAALQVASERGEDEVFVFGGASLYAEALPKAERLYLTRVHAEVEGDVFFPEIDWRNWQLVSERHHPSDERHAFAFTMQTWERV